MKTIIGRNDGCPKSTVRLARALVAAGFFICSAVALAQLPPGATNGPSYTPLDAWSFGDPANWTSDAGYAPMSFTNLAFSRLGNGQSLVVDSNAPAWLQYHVVENDGRTNLTVAVGSVTFWFAPGWSSVSAGGSGPNEWGRLLEVGAYTPDSSFGWWSLYMDAGGTNLYFSAQTNNFSSSVTTYVSAPISWTTNYFHYIALTYSPTNTALYLDGNLAATGPPITVYPGPDVLDNGFFIGSDSNGVWQAHGLFNDLQTYNVPVDAGTIKGTYDWGIMLYKMNPVNIPYMNSLNSAPSSPSTNMVTPDVITGAGNLQWDGAAGSTITSSNVWMTDVTASTAGDGTMSLTFTIQGGQDGAAYDVFATGGLVGALTAGQWGWMGQGYHGNIYTIPELPPGEALIILGTPLDSDGDGLTDAYELLVSHTDPNNPYSNQDGILDGWDVLLGLNPQLNNPAQSGERLNYGYTGADWLDSVSGVKEGTINLDNEGNVLSVSQ
jgi:Concanavalin A-like lectin/glucanases superfamily/Bacterial TSP3 repeat